MIKRLFYIIIITTLFLPWPCFGDLTNSSWPGFQANNQRTGQVNFLGPYQQAAGISWQADLGQTSLLNSPVVGREAVYLATNDGLKAFDFFGRPLWTFLTPEPAGTPALLLFPSAVPDKIALPAGQHLYLLYYDGTVAWHEVLTSPIVGTLASAGEMFYFSTADGIVHGYNWSGEIWTSLDIGGGTPAFSQDYQTLYVKGWGGLWDSARLYALNPANGQILWYFPVPWAFGSGAVIVPTVGENNYFAPLHSIFWPGKFYAINGSGQEIWSKHDHLTYSSPAVYSDKVIIGRTDSSLIVRNQTSGQSLWSYPTGGISYSSPAVDNQGNIYVGNDTGQLYALDINGNLLWQFNLTNSALGPPALLEEGTLYITSATTLYAIQVLPEAPPALDFSINKGFFNEQD